MTRTTGTDGATFVKLRRWWHGTLALASRMPLMPLIIWRHHWAINRRNSRGWHGITISSEPPRNQPRYNVSMENPVTVHTLSNFTTAFGFNSRPCVQTTGHTALQHLQTGRALSFQLTTSTQQSHQDVSRPRPTSADLRRTPATRI